MITGDERGRRPNQLELSGFLLALFKRSWWALAVRGLCAIVLGLVALAMPGATLTALIAMFGAYLVFDGAFTLITAFRAAPSEHAFWPYVLEGALSVIVGVLAFMHPHAFLLGTLLLIAARSILAGSAEIAAGTMLRRETGVGEWALWLAGAASLAFGLAVLLSPGLGIPVMVWFIAAYTIVFGAALIGEAFHIRSLILHQPAIP